MAFKKIASLPERKNLAKYSKGSKFEKSLTEFVSKRLKESFVPWKEIFEENQAIKKRAVIQMIDTTQSGQKKLFQRWKNMTELNSHY
jgi:hypothetical protein